MEFLLKTPDNLFTVPAIISLCIDIHFVLGEALPVVEIPLQPRGQCGLKVDGLLNCRWVFYLQLCV